MLAKRIVPCIDVKGGRVVKGMNFINLQDAGDPVKLAKKYSEEGADELFFLDITATIEGRKTKIDLVKEIAKNLTIPFAIGGGISSLKEISELLRAGAEKVSINSAAVRAPEIIKEVSGEFGSQSIVVAIDYKKNGNKYEVYVDSGRTPTKIDALKWAKKCRDLGAGELLLTSIDYDGTKKGFDLEGLKQFSGAVDIPIVASGGAGSREDFLSLFRETDIDAGLAASIFHFNEIGIEDLKNFLKKKGVVVRC
ncbi:MAG: imidazole glycerol phosphate synthase subunit HisF [Candidatus Diapherotrites archaeon]